MTQGWRRRGLGRRALWSGCCLLVATVAGSGVVTGQTAYASHADGPHVVFTIGSPQITESSSLAVSTVHPGLVYTTNDSGDDGTVYMLDRHGALVGRTTLAGADPLDVEAIAAADDGTLVVADIGDNAADTRQLTSTGSRSPDAVRSRSRPTGST